MIFLRCSGVSWLMCTSVYTPCSFIDLISCFIPSIVCSLSKPSVLFTQGSRRIFSACISCSSSLEVASIFCPFFVVTVTCEILILVVGGSWAVSGRLAAVALSVVLACFGELPCVISSVTSLLPCVGIGSAWLCLLSCWRCCHWKVCKCWWCCSVWLYRGFWLWTLLSLCACCCLLLCCSSLW